VDRHRKTKESWFMPLSICTLKLMFQWNISSKKKKKNDVPVEYSLLRLFSAREMESALSSDT